MYTYMKADNDSRKAGSESRLSSGYALGRARKMTVKDRVYLIGYQN